MPIIVGPGDPGSLVELTAIWLNDADDPSDYQTFQRAGESLSANTSAQVSVRQLIGRRRLIRTGSAPAAESMSLTFEQCTPSQVAWLHAHVGSLLCYRDHVGGKFYGVYSELPREISTAYRDRTDVKITLDEVSHSEAV